MVRDATPLSVVEAQHLSPIATVAHQHGRLAFRINAVVILGLERAKRSGRSGIHASALLIIRGEAERQFCPIANARSHTGASLVRQTSIGAPHVFLPSMTVFPISQTVRHGSPTLCSASLAPGRG